MEDRRGRKRVLYQHGATATARFALLYKQNNSCYSSSLDDTELVNR